MLSNIKGILTFGGAIVRRLVESAKHFSISKEFLRQVKNAIIFTILVLNTFQYQRNSYSQVEKGSSRAEGAKHFSISKEFLLSESRKHACSRSNSFFGISVFQNRF